MLLRSASPVWLVGLLLIAGSRGTSDRRDLGLGLNASNAASERSAVTEAPTKAHNRCVGPSCTGASILSNTFDSTARGSEAGPFTYTVTVKNASAVTGEISMSCISSSPSQLPCSIVPPDTTITSHRTFVATVTYSTKGIGTFTEKIKAHWGDPVGYGSDSITFTVRVVGMPIGTITNPVPGAQFAVGADTINALFSHPAGLDSATFKLVIDGHDSTSHAHKTTSSIWANSLQLSTDSTRQRRTAVRSLVAATRHLPCPLPLSAVSAPGISMTRSRTRTVDHLVSYRMSAAHCVCHRLTSMDVPLLLMRPRSG